MPAKAFDTDSNGGCYRASTHNNAVRIGPKSQSFLSFWL
jgi:hypothetical protein